MTAGADGDAEQMRMQAAAALDTGSCPTKAIKISECKPDAA